MESSKKIKCIIREKVLRFDEGNKEIIFFYVYYGYSWKNKNKKVYGRCKEHLSGSYNRNGRNELFQRNNISNLIMLFNSLLPLLKPQIQRFNESARETNEFKIKYCDLLRNFNYFLIMIKKLKLVLRLMHVLMSNGNLRMEGSVCDSQQQSLGSLP